MYCGIWGLISFPSSSSSAGASPALRASSNSNCFLWSSLDLNAAANQIWPPSQDHLTHKNSHISKFGCKAVCQIQRTNEFHNYKRKESSAHEGGERERESRSVWKLARLNNLSHIMPREIGFPKFRTEERGKKAPTKTQWKKETETKTTTHTHTHTHKAGRKERKGWRQLTWCGCHDFWCSQTAGSSKPNTCQMNSWRKCLYATRLKTGEGDQEESKCPTKTPKRQTLILVP
jgi:hypothetical protein